MAEFIILKNRDLRYIYSGRSVITPPCTRKSYITNIPHPELKKSILNFAEYARQAERDYRYVPSAPAFRFYSKQDLDEVVERLYSAKNREARSASSTRSARSLDVSKSKNKVLLPKRRRMTPEMVDETFRRLMQPTHMSTLKTRVPPPKLKPTFTRSLTM
ncbi:hypothetical protein FSP39_023481 [Pinctada imbricata]|uniref:Uncharacterized protein n=1 Tax=Pinctada imbricata TaxID=66713 RepID=A0AA88XNK2_PINIB|nr:hypothetical protein FSP39_023481 [Pinctada imbricata]